ncbi:MAG: hypothetical protein ABI348_09740 [Nitrososphaera sp.]
MFAAQVNKTWVAAIPAAIVLIAVGIALIVLGAYTIRNNRSRPHTEEHSSHH